MQLKLKERKLPLLQATVPPLLDVELLYRRAITISYATGPSSESRRKPYLTQALPRTLCAAPSGAAGF